MSKCFEINLVAFYRQQLVMGIGVVTLESGRIPCSKKCSLELAFNKNSNVPPPPTPAKKKKDFFFLQTSFRCCLHFEKIT